MFTPIKVLLPTAVKSAGIGPQVVAARVVGAANQALGALFDDPKNQRARARSFDAGLLAIAVKSPAYAQEIKLGARTLQTVIRENAGVHIKGFKFTYGI